jgi:mannose-6-phosphate isomerase-like protein (cupin superfamily)
VVGKPLILSPANVRGGGSEVRGRTLTIGNWPATGVASEVAPLHVHHEDDEAWHVISGALRFRFADSELVAEAGSTVLVPAGTAHTFGNAGPDPSRFIIIAPTRLDELIVELHAADESAHAEIYRRHASEVLE